MNKNICPFIELRRKLPLGVSHQNNLLLYIIHFYNSKADAIKSCMSEDAQTKLIRIVGPLLICISVNVRCFKQFSPHSVFSSRLGHKLSGEKKNPSLKQQPDHAR
jgi:hypothetical protein